jgi:hypothetical protein
MALIALLSWTSELIQGGGQFGHIADCFDYLSHIN